MLGISTSSFYGRLSTEDAIYQIADCGVECAEVFLNSFSEYEIDYIKMVSGRLKDNGLAFNSVHTLPTQFEPQLFAVTKRQREDAEFFMKKVMEAASESDCSVYVMHGKPFFKKNIGSFSVNIDAVSDRLNELCEIANSFNMKIALENVHWAMCNNLEFVNAIKNNVPDLGFTLDIKQAHLSGLHWIDYLNGFNDRLLNVHICDYIDKSTKLPGRGQVDFSCLSNELDRIEYKGNVILEVYEKDYTDFDDLQECVDFCQRFF